jgi:uracil permease
MIKIIPILIGIVASYLIAGLTGNVDFTTVNEAAWIGLPFMMENTVFSLIGKADPSIVITSIVAIVPIAIATIVEHIGDISAINSTTGKNFFADPGLHRTLLGDGLATSLASLFGAPANTTYSENTGVLGLTKVYDPRVIRIAAAFAVILSFSPKFAAVVSAMPVATLGGVFLVLYGMISAVGVRNIVENKVDLTKSRNVIIAALILVLAIGIKYGIASEAISFPIGSITISLSGIAVAAIVGIVLNAVLPAKIMNSAQMRKAIPPSASNSNRPVNAKSSHGLLRERSPQSRGSLLHCTTSILATETFVLPHKSREERHAGRSSHFNFPFRVPQRPCGRLRKNTGTRAHRQFPPARPA